MFYFYIGFAVVDLKIFMGLYLSEYGHFQIISWVLSISHQITNYGTFAFYILGKANEILFHSNGSGAYFLISNETSLGPWAIVTGSKLSIEEKQTMKCCLYLHKCICQMFINTCMTKSLGPVGHWLPPFGPLGLLDCWLQPNVHGWTPLNTGAPVDSDLASGLFVSLWQCVILWAQIISTTSLESTHIFAHSSQMNFLCREEK